MRLKGRNLAAFYAMKYKVYSAKRWFRIHSDILTLIFLYLVVLGTVSGLIYYDILAIKEG